jgi:hypothetical protein
VATGRRRKQQRSNKDKATLDGLEVGGRRLALIERLFIDVATVLWLCASLVIVLIVGAFRCEATFLTGLVLGLRLKR